MPRAAPPSHPDGRPDARTRVLDAAEAIIRARGVPALTLDGAAREAGVSKGGLLHHFASKEALLVALMRRLAEGIEADFHAIAEAQPEGPARALRACLAFTFDQPDILEAHSRAAAVLLAGLPAIRETPVGDTPRLPYCMMGICFDCLAEIDGVANRQACMVTVEPGMRIAAQRGARQARPGTAPEVAA